MQACDLERSTPPRTDGSATTRNAVALLAVCLAALMSGLEISSVPVILPIVEVVLHGDFAGTQWIMNAYTIACTTVLMATGILADRYGRKRVFLWSIGLFGMASLLCGLAWSMPVLIAARALQGASGGAMLICLVAVLSHQFPQGAERGRAFGLWGIVFGVGLGFGPLIGSVIVTISDWRWVFWVHVFIAVLTLALAIAGVRESCDPQTRKLDLAGIVTLSLAVLGLAYFVTQGAEAGFASAFALGILLASGVSFVAFLVIETRASEPMFDFSVFKVRKFSGALLGSAGMNFSFWPFVIYLPIYFQSALGQDTVLAGVSLLAYTLPTLVFPPIGERLVLRYGAGIVIPAGLFTIGLGFFLMRIGGIDQASWLTVLPGCLVAGAGLGMTNTPVTNTTTGSVSSQRAGMASGIDMSARMISLAINIALMGFLLVQGVLFHLRTVLAGPAESASASQYAWRELANSIASGNLHPTDAMVATAMSSETLAAICRAALSHGFGWIMLYGGIAAWVFAGASFLVFRRAKMRA
jgi:EmrB/QacA subfamily drug resistance transporter